MRDTWIEPASGTWLVEGRSPRIEYSLRVMEEICATAMEGLQKLSRGGIEVGGVLYGEQAGELLRITAWRPIACEHSRGPAFLLSDADREQLQAQLATPDESTQSLVPVGWFVSHTRSDIALRAEDSELYDEFFSEPWQVTLVLRPARHRGTDAGFFFREADGSVHTSSSLKTFSVSAFAKLPPADGVRAPRPRRQRTQAPAGELPRRAAAPPGVAPPKPTLPEPDPQPHQRPWTRLLLGAWIVLTLAILAGMVYLLYFADRVPQLGFRATDQDGQIHIEWDRNASRIRNAERGVLEVTDGGPKFELDLDQPTLRSGSFVYARKSDDVTLRLTVFQAKNTPLSEGTRFLSQPPSRVLTHEISRLLTEREKMRAEYADLEQKLDDEMTHSRQLQLQVKQLQQQLDALKPSATTR